MNLFGVLQIYIQIVNNKTLFHKLCIFFIKYMEDSVNQRFKNIVDYLVNSNAVKSKAEIARSLDIGNTKLSQILSGRNNVSVDNVISICREYGINYEYLLTGKGSVYINDINAKDVTIVNEPGFIYQAATGDAEALYDQTETEIFTNSNGNKFYIYQDNTIKIEVPLMTEPAYASYVEAYFDNAFVKNLPTTMFRVDKIGKGNYMAFTVKNNSMWNNGGYDTPSGAEILGREIGRHLWQDGFRKTDYGFILLTSKAIYHKDIKGYNPETGMLTLGSRSPEISDFNISINDVNKVFNVIKRAF